MGLPICPRYSRLFSLFFYAHLFTTFNGAALLPRVSLPCAHVPSSPPPVHGSMLAACFTRQRFTSSGTTTPNPDAANCHHSDRQKFGQSDADAASPESGSLEAAVPMPGPGHMTGGSDSAHAAAAYPNGEAACEGHGYTEDQCLAVGDGCCHWSPDTIPSEHGMPAAPGSGGKGACWSDIGDAPCVA